MRYVSGPWRVDVIDIAFPGTTCRHGVRLRSSPKAAQRCVHHFGFWRCDLRTVSELRELLGADFAGLTEVPA